MKSFKDWAPTGFDTRGLGLPEKQEWFVCEFGQNRDSDLVTIQKFSALVRRLDKIDPDRNDHEVHRFGHWACGWFEIVIVRPDSECARSEERLEKRRKKNDDDDDG